VKGSLWIANRDGDGMQNNRKSSRCYPKAPPIRQVGIVNWPYKTVEYLVENEKSPGDSEVKTDFR
jgi:hypothetical protein